MIELNRQKAPPFRKIEKIGYGRPEKVVLSNGIPLYLINAGTHDILRIELLFNAGTWNELRPLIASTTNAMLNEGTSNRTSEIIAESFDFYGSYFQLQVDNDTGSIILYTLSKYLEQTLEIVADIASNSNFPEKEFITLIRKKEQQFVEDQGKVKTLARKAFLKTVFGNDHPYGKEITVEDFQKVNQQMLVDYYENRYRDHMVCLMVSGKTWPEIDKVFNRFFGQNEIPVKSKFESDTTSTPVQHNAGQVIIRKENVYQSAIRIGKLLFNRHHPDYTGMQILNTVLGGYFGSRLMKNIREEKGYTYGIGSMILSMHYGGYFVIVSEVGSEVTKPAIDEVFKEIDLLRRETIPEQELSLVKNYILGQIVRMFDGPFSTADTLKSILEYGLDYDYYDRTVEKIKTITAKQLRDLANQYFKPDTFTEIVAGRY